MLLPPVSSAASPPVSFGLPISSLQRIDRNLQALALCPDVFLEKITQEFEKLKLENSKLTPQQAQKLADVIYYLRKVVLLSPYDPTRADEAFERARLIFHRHFPSDPIHTMDKWFFLSVGVYLYATDLFNLLRTSHKLHFSTQSFFPKNFLAKCYQGGTTLETAEKLKGLSVSQQLCAGIFFGEFIRRVDFSVIPASSGLIPEILKYLPNLEYVKLPSHLNNISISHVLKAIKDPKRLKEFCAESLHHLPDMNWVGNCTQLVKLVMTNRQKDGPQLINGGYFRTCTQLEHLDLSGYNITFWHGTPKLKELHVRSIDADNEYSLGQLSSCVNLQRLSIGINNKVLASAISALPQLQHLTLSQKDGVHFSVEDYKGFFSLLRCPQLLSFRFIKLFESSYRDFSFLTHSPLLERLELETNNFNCLTHCSNKLKYLKLKQSSHIRPAEAITPKIVHLRALEVLIIDNADLAGDCLSALSTCTNLKELHLINCRNFDLENLPQGLTVLNLEKSSGITHLDAIRNCPNLTVLNLNLTDMPLEDCKPFIPPKVNFRSLTLSNNLPLQNVSFNADCLTIVHKDS